MEIWNAAKYILTEDRGLTSVVFTSVGKVKRVAEYRKSEYIQAVPFQVVKKEVLLDKNVGTR